MTEQEMKEIMYKTVAIQCKELEDTEVAVLYMAVTLGNNHIEMVMGYDKIKLLFTKNEGKEMHEETKAAFLAYCENRLA